MTDTVCHTCGQHHPTGLDAFRCDLNHQGADWCRSFYRNRLGLTDHQIDDLIAQSETA